MSRIEAKNFILKTLKQLNKSIYMVRIIHGYNSGTILRNMIRKELRSHPKIKRIELSMNGGITDLIIKQED